MVILYQQSGIHIEKGPKFYSLFLYGLSPLEHVFFTCGGINHYMELFVQYTMNVMGMTFHYKVMYPIGK